jgi:membrane protein
VSSAVAFVWLASSGVDALLSSLESISGTARSWWRRRALAVACCLLLSLAVAALSVLGPGLGAFSSRVADLLPDLGRIGHLRDVTGPASRIVASLVVAFGYVSALYWIGVPARARVSIPIFPGALFAVLMQAVTSVGYGAYVSRAGNGSAYSAGLGIIGLVLTGLYLFALSLLTGVVVNQLVANRGSDRPRVVH